MHTYLMAGRDVVREEISFDGVIFIPEPIMLTITLGSSPNSDSFEDEAFRKDVESIIQTLEFNNFVGNGKG